jgi:hypothetical protein
VWSPKSHVYASAPDNRLQMHRLHCRESNKIALEPSVRGERQSWNPVRKTETLLNHVREVSSASFCIGTRTGGIHTDLYSWYFSILYTASKSKRPMREALFVNRPRHDLSHCKKTLVPKHISYHRFASSQHAFIIAQIYRSWRKTCLVNHLRQHSIVRGLGRDFHDAEKYCLLRTFVLFMHCLHKLRQVEIKYWYLERALRNNEPTNLYNTLVHCFHRTL